MIYQPPIVWALLPASALLVVLGCTPAGDPETVPGGLGANAAGGGEPGTAPAEPGETAAPRSEGAGGRVADTTEEGNGGASASNGLPDSAAATGEAGADPMGGMASDEVAMPHPAGDSDVDWTAWRIVHPKMYSAYDGVHVFSLPVYVDGVSVELEGWQASPADAVGLDPWRSDDGSQTGVLVTILRPEPTIRISASVGSLGGTAEIHVTHATPEMWEMGKQRYQNGATFDPAAFMEAAMLNTANIAFGPDGTPMLVGGAADFGDLTDLRCDTCHTSGAEQFQVEHTPTQTAQYSDADLIGVFTTGMKPPGSEFRILSDFVRDLYEYFHTWQVTPEQAEGLVIYLRSLAPKGQGEVAGDVLDGTPPRTRRIRRRSTTTEPARSQKTKCSLL